MGGIEQNIIKQAMRFGGKLPDRIANAPRLTAGLDLFLQAFFDLDSERASGMDRTPIPWVSIKQYAEFYKFSEEQTEDLFFLVRRMDNAHLKRLREKDK